MQLGMHLIGVERQTYRTDPFRLFEQIAPDFEAPFYIPEGGAVWEALPGMLSIWHELQAQLSLPATHLLLAIGTGTTFAGLVKGATQMGLQTAVWGIVALKVPPAEQPGSFAQFLDGNVPLPHQLLWNHHGGGYAKTTLPILETTKAFETQTGIPLDPVYTAKVVAATQQLANEGAFAPGSRVVLLHTGGIFN
jgi:1-aminocyclopropane-1-carboxylate deaminase